MAPSACTSSCRSHHLLLVGMRRAAGFEATSLWGSRGTRVSVLEGVAGIFGKKPGFVEPACLQEEEAWPSGKTPIRSSGTGSIAETDFTSLWGGASSGTTRQTTG